MFFLNGNQTRQPSAVALFDCLGNKLLGEVFQFFSTLNGRVERLVRQRHCTARSAGRGIGCIAVLASIVDCGCFPQ